jgi:hypothetical protein
VLGVLLVAALAAACGRGAPPLLGDRTPPEPDAGDQLKTEAGGPPRCALATPELGVCDCTEVDLLTDVPNMYFVLDRSGSMNDGAKWPKARDVVVGTARRIGKRASFGAALFPGLMDGSGCDSGREVMSVRRGDDPPGSFGPTSLALAQATNVPASGGTPTSATLEALTPKLGALTGRTFVVLATDGGPNCNGAATCSAAQCQLNIEGVCGPENCCAPSSYGPLHCIDGPATLDAVTALAALGIKTFVIGMPGSAAYATLLDQLADAGGTARAGSPRYYRVDSTDGAALETALSQVAARVVGTCTLPLGSVPEDEGRVNVFLDGQPVAKDPTDGWRVDGKTVELLGTTCARVMAGEVLSVRVITGCPTLMPR